MHNLVYPTQFGLPLHHRRHSASGVQELHQYGQAVTVLVLARLHKQRHLVREGLVFFAAVGIVNIEEFPNLRAFECVIC